VWCEGITGMGWRWTWGMGHEMVEAFDTLGRRVIVVVTFSDGCWLLVMY
jgi:hypothetical protein